MNEKAKINERFFLTILIFGCSSSASFINKPLRQAIETPENFTPQKGVKLEEDLLLNVPEWKEAWYGTFI